MSPPRTCESGACVSFRYIGDKVEVWSTLNPDQVEIIPRERWEFLAAKARADGIFDWSEWFPAGGDFANREEIAAFQAHALEGTLQSVD
jgi:hypothetical protein